MAEDGVDRAEAGNKGAARRDVDRGQDKEAGGQWDVWEEDAPAFGIADARDELDGGVQGGQG